MDGATVRLASLLGDWRWRLNNLYYITDKEGRKVQFRMNWAQEELFEDLHYLNIVLKARQLGFSTFICIYMLDQCMFNSNKRAGVIAHTMNDAQAIFKDKVEFPYNSLPEQLRAARPLITDSKTELAFNNNSSLRVGTSLRSGTLNYLHISEHGKICAKYPDKAREVRTGALNTVQAGQVIFIESTAEGQEGDFYELCQSAQTKKRLDQRLTSLDFKFHFYPWWREPGYVLDADGVTFSPLDEAYFTKVEKEIGQPLSPDQRAWYVKKREVQHDDMKREYPSTPAEAFEASVEGAIYGPQMEALETAGRVGHFPPIAGVPVHTFWDIGRRDYTSIVFAQVLVGKVRIVGFYQNCMQGMPHYAQRVSEIYTSNGWKRGRDVFPHDAKVVEWGSDRSRIEQLAKAGFDHILGTELSLHDGINAVRATLGVVEFHEPDTKEIRAILKQYRWEWDDIRGAWKTGTPRHDDNSHGADAFRTLGTSWREIIPDIAAKPEIKPSIAGLLAGEATKMTPAEFLALIKKERQRHTDD